MENDDKTASLEQSASHEAPLVLKSVDKDIICTDRIQIDCNLPQNTKIEANRSIVINGNVGEGCSLTCTSGPIIINGNVYGSADKPVTISSKQYFNANSLCHAIVKSSGSLTVIEDVVDSKVTVTEMIYIKGSLIRSEAVSNSRIVIRTCGRDDISGSDDASSNKLSVMPTEILTLLQKLLKVEAKMGEVAELIPQLQRTIDMLKKLRTDLGSLPQDKHELLVSSVVKFDNLTAESKELEERKGMLKKEVIQLMHGNWITVEGGVYPLSVIKIANRSLAIKTSMKNRLRFFVKNNRVEFDS
jgi:hypothetical protein